MMWTKYQTWNSASLLPYFSNLSVKSTFHDSLLCWTGPSNVFMWDIFTSKKASFNVRICVKQSKNNASIFLILQWWIVKCVRCLCSGGNFEEIQDIFTQLISWLSLHRTRNPSYRWHTLNFIHKSQKTELYLDLLDLDSW